MRSNIDLEQLAKDILNLNSKNFRIGIWKVIKWKIENPAWDLERAWHPRPSKNERCGLSETIINTFSRDLIKKKIQGGTQTGDNFIRSWGKSSGNISSIIKKINNASPKELEELDNLYGAKYTSKYKLEELLLSSDLPESSIDGIFRGISKIPTQGSIQQALVFGLVKKFFRKDVQSKGTRIGDTEDFPADIILLNDDDDIELCFEVSDNVMKESDIESSYWEDFKIIFIFRDIPEAIKTKYGDISNVRLYTIEDYLRIMLDHLTLAQKRLAFKEMAKFLETQENGTGLPEIKEFLERDGAPPLSSLSI